MLQGCPVSCHRHSNVSHRVCHDWLLYAAQVRRGRVDLAHHAHVYAEAGAGGKHITLHLLGREYYASGQVDASAWVPVRHLQLARCLPQRQQLTMIREQRCP